MTRPGQAPTNVASVLHRMRRAPVSGSLPDRAARRGFRPDVGVGSLNRRHPLGGEALNSRRAGACAADTLAGGRVTSTSAHRAEWLRMAAGIRHRSSASPTPSPPREGHGTSDSGSGASRTCGCAVSARAGPPRGARSPHMAGPPATGHPARSRHRSGPATGHPRPRCGPARPSRRRPWPVHSCRICRRCDGRSLPASAVRPRYVSGHSRRR